MNTENRKEEGFFQKVYTVTAQIPKGCVATYGQIAALAGNPLAARQVGYAMSGVPDGLQLPCHRVINRKGELAPDDVFGDRSIQRAMLRREGITFLPDGRIDLERHLWRPEDSADLDSSEWQP